MPYQKALHSSAGLRQEVFWPNISQMQWNLAMHEQPRLSMSGSVIPCWWQVVRRVEEIEARSSGEPAGVVVVGAGYAGVELASTVAERLGRRAAVQLVSAG